MSARESLAISILSVFRMGWSVRSLDLASGFGEDTPVSGDAIAQARFALTSKVC